MSASLHLAGVPNARESLVCLVLLPTTTRAQTCLKRKYFCRLLNFFPGQGNKSEGKGESVTKIVRRTKENQDESSATHRDIEPESDGFVAFARIFVAATPRAWGGRTWPTYFN